MNKAKVVKLVLTIVKYGITLILGYLGGSEDKSDTILNDSKHQLNNFSLIHNQQNPD